MTSERGTTIKSSYLNRSEICLERIYILDFYDGILSGIACDESGVLFRLTKRQELEIDDEVYFMLDLYKVEQITDETLCRLFRENTPSNLVSTQLVREDWCDLILAKEPDYVEYWLSFCLKLGRQHVYPIISNDGSPKSEHAGWEGTH
jgi:hypothetical protein